MPPSSSSYAALFSPNYPIHVPNLIRTVLLTPAFVAVGAHPYTIELIHDVLDQRCVRRDYTGLEITALWAFCAHTSAGQVRASGIGRTPIYNHGLEMNPRADDAFDTGDQIVIPVKIEPEIGTRFLGVEQADGNALLT